MTYEEALARLLQIAGDYNEVYNTRALNEAIARKELEQINVEIKKLVEDLSPSPNFLNITLDSCGYPMILSSRGNTTFYNWIYGIMGEDKEEAIRSYFERLLLAFLKNYIRTDRVTLEEITRANSYVSLIYRSLTPELLETFSSAIQKWKDRRAEDDRDMKNFTDYRVNVCAAMKDAAICWLREVEILPDMKLSIVNLKTRVSEVRTVKRVSYTGDVRTISFKENSSIIKGDDRIESVASWLMNNPEYSGLSKLYY